MSMFDAVMSLVVTIVFALALRGLIVSFCRPRQDNEIGYLPGSDAPEGGWLWPALAAIGVAVVVFAGLFGYVGSAVF